MLAGNLLQGCKWQVWALYIFATLQHLSLLPVCGLGADEQIGQQHTGFTSLPHVCNLEDSGVGFALCLADTGMYRLPGLGFHTCTPHTASWSAAHMGGTPSQISG